MIKFMGLIEAEEARTLNLEQKKELVDVVYVLRETAALFDSMRKQFNKMQDSLEEIYTLGSELEVKSDAKLAHPTVRTEYATASIKMRFRMPFPHPERDKVKYAEFCKNLGINADLIKHGAINFSYERFPHYIGECVTEAKPLPPGIDPYDMYMYPEMTIRRIKPLNPSETKEGEDNEVRKH